MVRVFYISNTTYIDYGFDNRHTLRIDSLEMDEALELAIDIKCDFDYSDVTSEEIDNCVNMLRDNYNILIEDGSLALSKFLTNYANVICKGDLSK